MSDPFITRSIRRGLDGSDAATLRDHYDGTTKAAAKADIVGQGARIDRMHILLDGWACKYKTMGDGGRQLLCIHLPGDIIDLDRIFQDRLGFGVMAVTECRTTSIPLATLRSLIDERRSVRDFLWLSTTDENAAMLENIANNGRRSPRQGIAHLICDLLFRLETMGKVEDGGFRLELRQHDIADLLGLSLVHTNKILQSLKAEDLLRISGRHLQVVDRDALQKIASFDQSAAIARHGQTCPMR